LVKVLENLLLTLNSAVWIAFSELVCDLPVSRLCFSIHIILPGLANVVDLNHMIRYDAVASQGGRVLDSRIVLEMATFEESHLMTDCVTIVHFFVICVRFMLTLATAVHTGGRAANCFAL